MKETVTTAYIKRRRKERSKRYFKKITIQTQFLFSNALTPQVIICLILKIVVKVINITACIGVNGEVSLGHQSVPRFRINFDV